MTDTVPARIRVRWFRRRPDAGLDRFGRGMWWAGHGQFFIAAALTIAAPVIFLFAIWEPQLVLYGMFTVALSAPFLLSGLMLRGAARIVAPESDHQLGYAGWSWRIAWLIGAVLFIALLATCGVFAGITVLIVGGGLIPATIYIALMLCWIMFG